RYKAGEPILARPTPAWERVAKWAKRRPAVAGLLAAVVLVTVGGFVGTYSQYRDAVQESKEKGTALEKAKEAEAMEGRAKDDARKKEAWAMRELHRTRSSFLTARLQQVASVYQRDPLRGLELLEDTNACPLDVRDFAWRLCYRW